MENPNESTFSQPELILNPEACNHLMEARKWSMFLSVFGLIMCGIMLIALLAILSLNSISTFFPFGVGMVIPYAILILLYVLPFYYLLQFSTLSKRALTYLDSNLLTQAMFNLKRHYRFMGIMVIVLLSFYFLMIVIVLFFLGGTL